MVITLIDGTDNRQINDFSEALKFYFKTLPDQYTINYINASQMLIQPCRKCFRCWIYSPGSCYIHDDMRTILNCIQSSDTVLFVAELIDQSLSNIIQIIMSRTVPLAKSFVQSNGRYCSDLKRYTFGFILANSESLNFQTVEQVENQAYSFTNLLGAPQKYVFYGKPESIVNQLNHFIRIQ